MKWYPTNVLLPDGTTLITGGFKQCCETPGDWNLSVETFDPQKQAAGTNPWNVPVQHEEGNPDMPPTRGYTNLFLLPAPVPAASAGGIARPIAMFAGAGKVLLFSNAPGLAASQRFFSRPNAVLPGTATVEKGEGASGAMLPDGKLTFLGGSAVGATAEKFHIYDPVADAWTQFSTGISRHFGNNLLLPDGTILAINGYKLNTTYIGDVRRPQIIDPVARTVATLPAWDNDVLERGYHSFSVLLKDGRILIGGGTAAGYAIACERADARVFSPPYLTAGPRPVPSNVSDGLVMSVGGQPITVKYTGAAVRAARGAVLMAPNSDTHAFDMGQRYVPLLQASPSAGTLALTPPPNSTVAPPGEYVLYLISGTATPSVGIHVRLRQLPSPWVNGDIGSVAFPGSALSASGKFTVRGSGTDIWGTADQFQFVRRPITGDGSITARITGPANTNAWAKAGVMIRESAAAGSRHANMVVSAASGVSFQRCLATGGVSTATTAPINNRIWVRLTRVGNRITAYASANGTVWDPIGSDTITMPASALMGLSLTSHNGGAVTQADFQDVTAVE
ncbi:MAG TPA: galactose oxidase-like domain-containing protein [Fibrobacteria bacterium]|nr:galactose oxidase-like domain-containing protein [Fibrobacteria bacterium]